MPHRLLPVETIARRSLRDGAVASWPKPSGRSALEERNTGIVIMLSMKMRGRKRGWSRQMIADGPHGQTADAPERQRDQRNGAERAPAAGIERFFRQARGDETGDKDVLPIGIGARLIEALQRVLVGGLGEFVLALQL